jgi:hypothetical protein
MTSSMEDFAPVGDDVWISGGGANSNLGHDVEYRYDYGDGTISPWGSSTQYYAWSAVGTYEIKGQGRCSIHTEFESDWTAPNHTELIRIYEGAETMLPVELLPAGSIDLDPFFESNYTVKSMSSHGHVYEARIDYGDGNVSDWVSAYYPLRPVYFKYTYETSGTFQMVGQSRCIDHPSVISDWSVATTVTVSEAVSRPIVTGSATATVGVPATFDVDAFSTAGHAIEYELSVSETHPLVGYVAQPWTTTLPLEYTFPSDGTRYIRVTARCIAHPEILSLWSNPALTIIVSP